MGGQSEIVEKPMLAPQQGLKIAAIDIHDEALQFIDIEAMESALFDPAPKESLKQDSMLDDKYQS